RRLGQRDEAIALSARIVAHDEARYAAAPRTGPARREALEALVAHLLVRGDVLEESDPAGALAAWDRALALEPTWLEPFARVAELLIAPDDLEGWTRRVDALVDVLGEDGLRGRLPALRGVYDDLIDRGAEPFAAVVLDRLVARMPQNVAIRRARLRLFAAGPL